MSASLTIDAKSLGESFAEDPEFTLPRRPRYIPELLQIPFGQNALLFEGARDLQVVAGRSSRTFLPQLLAVLDGTRTIDELRARFPQLPSNAVRDALVLLYTRGLLEDGDAERLTPVSSALASFAGRYCDATRANASRGQVLERLAATRIAVVDNAVGRATMRGLQGHGFARLDLLASPADLHAGAHDLLVAGFAADDHDAAEWCAAALHAGVRVLHGHLGSETIEIGPYFIPGQSGCYDCMRALHAAPSGAAADLSFWAGVLALQASTLVSRLGSVKLYNACRVHKRSANGPVYEKRNLARLPGCRTCGLEGAGPHASHPDLRAWVLHHASHVMTCKELRSPRDHQIHYAASNLVLTRKPPQPRHGVPLLPLPDSSGSTVLPSWTQAPATDRRMQPDLALLGQMLHYAAGYQPTTQGPRRLAASGGGLGSSDLFVVVRHLAGVDPGAYHYFGASHCLERIGWVEDGLLAGALGVETADLPSVLVVGTSDMQKTRKKYDEFSFRIGALDGGVACQMLHEVAAAHGVAVREHPDLRDKVAAFLLHFGSAGNRRMVTFALGLGAPGGGGVAPDPLGHHYQTPDLLIELCARRGPTVLPPAPAAQAIVSAHARRPLESLVMSRRSHRRFAERALPPDVLRSIAAIAWEAQTRRVEAGALDIPMQLWMAVVRGTPDMPAGVYRWDAARSELQCTRPGLARAELLTTMQQHGYADAAVTCFVTCDFERTLREHGVRGYREASSRAGSMLARAQLGGLSWQVVGSMWGGVAEEGVGRLLDVDRYHACPLFAASFGAAPDA